RGGGRRPAGARPDGAVPALRRRALARALAREAPREGGRRLARARGAPRAVLPRGQVRPRHVVVVKSHRPLPTSSVWCRCCLDACDGKRIDSREKVRDALLVWAAVRAIVLAVALLASLPFLGQASASSGPFVPFVVFCVLVA